MPDSSSQGVTHQMPSQREQFALRWCLALLLLTLIGGCTEAPSPNAQRTQSNVAIVAHRVEYRAQQSRIEAVGTARARKSAGISAETGGEVSAIYVQAGQRIEAGAVILTLESRQETLALQRAEVAVKNAEQLLTRYQRIDVDGAISDSQIDAAKTAVEASRIELAIAQNNLTERTVIAPFAGYLGLSDIDSGTRITPTDEITQLDDRAVLYVDFDAPEQVFGAVAVGDPLDMQPFADPAATYTAKVLAVNSNVDPNSRAFTVRAQLDNSDDKLRPGMSFRVGFTITGPRYPAIPEAAISWGGDGPYLWEVEEGIAKRQPVSIVARTDGLVLVKADFSEGTMIIAKGVQKVREGTPVKAVRTKNQATLGGQ